MEKLKVDIKNEKGKVVFSCVIHELSVAMEARKNELMSEIFNKDISDATKGMLFSCAAFAATFHNEDGTLMYPDKPKDKDDEAEDEESAAYDVYNTLSAKVYKHLCDAYVEVNPIETTLDAKKKKF